MTNQAILEKAIKKAIKNGWAKKEAESMLYTIGKLPSAAKFIVFDQDFAKALWGEEDLDKYVRISGSNQLVETVAWVHHLQQMMVAEDPIDYLGKNLPK